MGEYIVTARRSGDTWYVGAITDWTPRDVEVDLAPLGIGGTVEATIFRDGVNADRKASDYKRETIRIDTAEPLKIHLHPEVDSSPCSPPSDSRRRFRRPSHRLITVSGRSENPEK